MGNVDNGEVVMPERGEAHIKKSLGTVGPNEAAPARTVRVCFRKPQNEGVDCSGSSFQKCSCLRREQAGDGTTVGIGDNRVNWKRYRIILKTKSGWPRLLRELQNDGRDHLEQRP